jgi:GT2 family glycosyltransferase
VSHTDKPCRATVIIVTYNAAEHIRDCLRSVLDTLPVDCEFLVVDNASDDGTLEAIQAAYPTVRVIAAGGNRGFGAGCNLGARQAQGRSLIFLNPDTTVQPGWVEGLDAALRRHPRVGLVTGLVLLKSEPAQINACGLDIHISGLSLTHGLGAAASEFQHPQEVAAVSGALFAIEAELFHALGGFDEDMFLYMEDVDLSWRARLAGWNVIYAPDSVVLHDYKLKLGRNRMFHQERNRYLMLLKSLRWRTQVMLLPAFLFAELITWGFVLAKRLRASEKIAAYLWIVTHWSTIMAKRRDTQALRTVGDRELLRHTVSSLAFHQVSNPTSAAVTRVVFNPLFRLWRALALHVVRW